MKSITRAAALLVLSAVLVLAGCGGDDDPAAPQNPGGGGTTVNMSATVDGAAWQAVAASARSNSGLVVVSGADLNGATGLGFGFLSQGTGVYNIGPFQVVNANVISNAGGSWVASDSNGSGTITITTLTATRIAGTFTFTAPLISGATTPATRVVTNGAFDLPLTTTGTAPGP